MRRITAVDVSRRLKIVIVCILVGLIALAGANPAAAQSPDPSIVEQCSALLPPDRPMPTGADAPSITITAPQDGEVIYGSQALIQIETENFDLNTEARHWHLWVDGTLMGMVYQDSALIDLEPGTHTLCASLGNTDHADLGVPAGLVVTVQQAAAGTPTAALAVSPDVGQVIPEPDITPGQIILIVGLGLAAAVGGWWFGSRLGKRKR